MSIFNRKPLAEADSLIAGNTAFAFDLYNQLSGSPGNIFFSPFSISACLTMAYAGARNNTERQMGKVLRVSGDQSSVHKSFGRLHSQLNELEKDKVVEIRRGMTPYPGQRSEYTIKSGIELSIANALWAHAGHPFRPEFLKVAREEYQANVNQADFNTGPEAIIREINQWVAQKTKDKIRNIIGPGSVDALTRLILANAVYFKGGWATPFKTVDTSRQPFHLSSSRQVDAWLMHHVDEVRYTENREFQAVELPYKGNELSMLILLPRQIDGCAQLERQLSPALLSRSLAQMERRSVEIFLPRFTLESSFNLNDTLARLGMSDAFGVEADFSGIDGTRDLLISGLYHKAWAQVTEEGTEAAAATMLSIALGLAHEKPPPPPPVFRADHPFLFVIRETRSGTLLFLGRLADPGRQAE